MTPTVQRMTENFEKLKAAYRKQIDAQLNLRLCDAEVSAREIAYQASLAACLDVVEETENGR